MNPTTKIRTLEQCYSRLSRSKKPSAYRMWFKALVDLLIKYMYCIYLSPQGQHQVARKGQATASSPVQNVAIPARTSRPSSAQLASSSVINAIISLWCSAKSTPRRLSKIMQKISLDSTGQYLYNRIIFIVIEYFKIVCI